MEFITKEEYIEWRAEWRLNYAVLSKTIRETKRKMKDAMKSRRDASVLQWDLIKMRWKAREELYIRKQSKIKAAEMYLEAKRKTITDGRSPEPQKTAIE